MATAFAPRDRPEKLPQQGSADLIDFAQLPIRRPSQIDLPEAGN